MTAKRKLVDRVKGKGKAALGGLVIPAVPASLRGGWPPYGLEIDGAVYPLDGQPPLATTNGWGQVPGR
jgi:hypothetical protein